MTRKAKYSLLAASAVATMLGSQAQAAFTYDLRFAPVAQPTAPTTPYLVTNPTPGVYHLQLWAQVTGNLAASTDTFTQGFFSIASNGGTGAGLAFTGGGLQNGVVPTSNWPTGLNGVSANLSSDGIADWGSSVGSDTASGYGLWQNSNTVVGGSTVAGLSQAGGTQAGTTAATWEVLAMNIDVLVSGVNAATAFDQQTAFNAIIASGTKFGTTAGKQNAINVNIDNVKNTVGTNGLGVVFDIPAAVETPEPASIGVLALGGLALLARRRKQA